MDLGHLGDDDDQDAMSNGGDDTDGERNDDDDVEETVSAEECDNWIPPLFFKAKECLTDVMKIDGKSLMETCIACWSGEVANFSHPFFEGGLCGPCKQRLLRTMFAKIGDCYAFCTICGTRSTSSINCSGTLCAKNYCGNCINIWTDSGDALLDLNVEDDWDCFLCLPHLASNPSAAEPIFSLQPHPDWLQRVLAFHEPLAAYRHRPLKWKPAPLRVLSLFDGIGTGLLSLLKLGIHIEVYYASEVMRAAATVSRTRLGHAGLHHVGSVGELTRHELRNMMPIHLLIGGSPCNDFSGVNRFPKDFFDPNGFSLYFFDFVRIRGLLQEMNRDDQHLLWLFENVCSMPNEYRDTISMHLDCQPAVIDAKDFSPQLRRRYFWGNIPGLFTLANRDPAAADGGQRKLNLNQVLMPGSGRKATKIKVRTLTTNSNSLLQGRKEDCTNRTQRLGLLPVRFGEKRKNDWGEKEVEDEDDRDVLWMQEFEEIFGFPRHFTDVGNISRTERQKLLGHAWSVPVVASIFAPLRAYTLSVPPQFND